MSREDEQVYVYFGEDSDSLVLKTLLEGSQISAEVTQHSASGPGLGRVDVRVSVARRDLERAQPLVDDFKNRGNRS
jgi:hypothetical protein